MKIYFAGPLFSSAERSFNVRMGKLLEKSRHEVWLPQEHEPRKKDARLIFLKDVEGIDWADVVVANMDGADPDSGTCWECGYAYGKKPVIVFRTDFRAAGDTASATYNLMLSESATARIDLSFATEETLAAAIHKELRSLDVRPHARTSRKGS
jgi:nucleoside 2-deoxyribosyltransferase